MVLELKVPKKTFVILKIIWFKISALVIPKQGCAHSLVMKKGLHVRTERYARYISKKVNLLCICKILFDIIDMDKITCFSHSHVLSIRGETHWAYTSHISLKDANRALHLTTIPNATGFVLITSCKHTSIRMPCRWKWVIKVST